MFQLRAVIGTTVLTTRIARIVVGSRVLSRTAQPVPLLTRLSNADEILMR